MAKSGKISSHATRLLRDAAKNSGWTLCVGAGASHGIFPSWHELTEEIAAGDPQVGDSVTLVKSLSERYSLDAFIEAAHDRLGINEQQFRDLLTTTLYRRFMQAADSRWPSCARCLSTGHPGGAAPKNWYDFLCVIRKMAPSSSALRLADFILRTISWHFPPLAVLTFNAEPLLFALCNALSTEREEYRIIAAQFDRIIHSASNRRPGRIPFYYCHGLLPIPGASQSDYQHSVDKLVFAEHEYLQLASTNHSWQSTTFVNLCSTSVVLFVGASLTDPNMRRWLSWIHANRVRELRLRSPTFRASSRHFWVTVSTGVLACDLWTESLVAGLGVRIIWIDSWNELGELLDRII